MNYGYFSYVPNLYLELSEYEDTYIGISEVINTNIFLALLILFFRLQLILKQA